MYGNTLYGSTMHSGSLPAVVMLLAVPEVQHPPHPTWRSPGRVQTRHLNRGVFFQKGTETKKRKPPYDGMPRGKQVKSPRHQKPPELATLALTRQLGYLPDSRGLGHLLAQKAAAYDGGRLAHRMQSDPEGAR